MSTLLRSEPTLSEGEARAISVEAYVYLYPLVTMEITRRQMTNLPPETRLGVAPMGVFAHTRAFPPADFRSVVRPNFDTLYSSAWLDLTVEPMVISVPDTGGRYYLMPMLGMWTDVFAVPGKRTSGTQAVRYVVTPPGWQGQAPDDADVIQAPTPYVWIIGRIQTNGPGDYAAVHEVQDGLSIMPLSKLGQAPAAVTTHSDPTVDMDTPPLEQVHALSGRDFFTLAAALMKVVPPNATDWSILARMRRIGLGPGQRFDYERLEPGLQRALDAAPGEALALMQATMPRMARVVNGWQMNTETIGVYGNHYLKRAMVDMVGLGANPAEDAVYPLGLTDADGQPLDGDHDYVLHFEEQELPPVDAFWSLTMYDAQGFQVDNPIGRFAIGDRDDLVYNTDGSLDLYIQHVSPGPDKEANWLPALPGPLGVTMRLYSPRPEVLDGRWNPPSIRRAAHIGT